jgi:Asp-tRNA(Asn)/Glu-tRNA(Gln) amidotransferase A subunit family amidase
MGAQLLEVVIPDLEAGRIAHLITIAGEMALSLDRYYAEHHREYGADVRINLALARLFTTMDYVQSQQVRTRLIANFARALEQVDVILTPATALPAPLIPEAALQEGESDLSTLVEILRFSTPANLTGLPAISFPVGYNQANLPLGMQAIGRLWQEPTLLRLALAAERVVDRKSPQVFYRILPD